MALSGMDIFKLLPKTNCQECGVPTCLAFAMKLAAGQAELASCPYVSDEAREKLEEASTPPIRPVTIGAGDSAFKIGGENVIFRHEKIFVNKPAMNASRTSRSSSSTCSSCWPSRQGARSRVFPTTPWRPWWATSGRATSAS